MKLREVILRDERPSKGRSGLALCHRYRIPPFRSPPGFPKPQLTVIRGIDRMIRGRSPTSQEASIGDSLKMANLNHLSAGALGGGVRYKIKAHGNILLP